MTALIQVLTYNLHKGFSPGKLRFLLPKMREAIEAVGTDLVFLQEVQGRHRRREKRIEAWPDGSQVEFIAEQLWPHFAYGKNAIYESGHHGNAILSQHPFVNWENINVALVPRASRSLLHGQIQLADSTQILHAICIHLGFFKAERKEQLTVLIDRIASTVPENEPLIIAGDFNDWRVEATTALEKTLNLQEVFKTLQGKHAKTFPAWGPTLRVDRIYYRGVTLVGGECLNGKPWRLLSDHLPLHAKFLIA